MAWIEVKAFTRKSAEKRKLDEFKEVLQKGDALIVDALSRLARSVGQIAILVDGLVNGGIKVITIKEGMELNGKRYMKAKVMLTMFIACLPRSKGTWCPSGPRRV